MKTNTNANALSLKEAGAICNVLPLTILELAQKGCFRAYRIGKLWRVDKTSLDAYLESTSTVPAQKA